MQKITQTFLSRKPKEGSTFVSVVVIAFVLAVSWLYWKNLPGISNLLPASPQKVFQQKEYWRLWTALGVHSDFGHFLSNAFFLLVLGHMLYGAFGLWVYPFGMFLIGALVHLLSLLTYPPDTQLIGASGVVYLMAGTWLTLYLLIERKVSLKRRWINAIAVALIVLVPTSIRPHVSERTHAIGFGLGILFGMAVYFIRRKEIRSAEVTTWVDEGEPDVSSEKPLENGHDDPTASIH